VDSGVASSASDPGEGRSPPDVAETVSKTLKEVSGLIKAFEKEDDPDVSLNL
jgi:hypothetical protein